jgi:hypothetical protein
VDLSKVDFTDVKSLKSGDSCAYYALGLIGPFGESSLPAAIADAKITTVKALDHHGAFYILFSKNCVRVYGS